MPSDTEPSADVARTLLDAAQDAVWCVDGERRLLYANPWFQAAALAAYGMKFRIGDDVVESIREGWPAIAADFEDLYARVLAGETVTAERSFPFDQTLRHFLISMYPVREPGQPVRIACTSKDVTDLKNAEEVLRQSRELFSELFQASPAPVMVTTAAEGRIVVVNDAFVEVTGYTREEAIGHTTLGLGLWPSTEWRAQLVRSLLTNGKVMNVEVPLRAKSGRQVWALASFVRTRIAGREVIVSVAEDISERKLAAERLRESEERFSKIFHASPAPTVITDPATNLIIDCNEAFADMTGWTRAELVGQSPRGRGLWADLSQRERMKQELAETGQIMQTEVTLRRKGGDLRWAECSFVRTELAGKPVTVSVCEDISEKKLWEDQRRQLSKLEAVGQLAGGVAHDFNNLLTVITAATEMVLEGRLSEAGERRALVRVHDAAGRAARLTSQLLSFGRRQPMRPVRIGTNREVEEMAEILRRSLGEQIRLEVDADPRVSTIVIDTALFHQALVDLALNARDAMPNGGTLTLRTCALHEGSRKLPRDIPRGEWVLVEVSDTGVGMSSEVQARIFEPFFTTKPLGQGSGLGLSSVYGIVRQSGGHVRVESKPGRGTCFRLYFPAATPLTREEEATTH